MNKETFLEIVDNSPVRQCSNKEILKLWKMLEPKLLKEKQEVIEEILGLEGFKEVEPSYYEDGNGNTMCDMHGKYNLIINMLKQQIIDYKNK
jgi:hypothetical protein